MGARSKKIKYQNEWCNYKYFRLNRRSVYQVYFTPVFFCVFAWIFLFILCFTCVDIYSFCVFTCVDIYSFCI